MVGKANTKKCRQAAAETAEIRRMVLDFIEELGGAEEAAKRMKKRGRHAMSIAIEILGGQVGLAEVLDMTPQGVSKLLLKEPQVWPHNYLVSIAKATKIPTDALGAEGPPLRIQTNGAPK